MQITLDQVSVRRGDFFLQASGTFGPGIHLLTGRIGSGKSTLGELMSQVRQPDKGRVIRDGVHSSVLSMQFPEYHITTMTAGEEVSSWGRDPALVLPIAGLAGRGDADLLTLSRGELKRLHLACLLAGSYDLLVLDEPFAGLDEEARYWISSHLALCQSGIIIIISHDITTLPPITHLWEMHQGRLTAVGPVPEVIPAWERAPPLIRYLCRHGAPPAGLAWQDLVEAVCRIHG